MNLDTIRDRLGFSSEKLALGHDHDHGDAKAHGHTHGVIDATIASTDRGIWAIKWSFVILAITAAFHKGPRCQSPLTWTQTAYRCRSPS